MVYQRIIVASSAFVLSNVFLTGCKNEKDATVDFANSIEEGAKKAGKEFGKDNAGAKEFVAGLDMLFLDHILDPILKADPEHIRSMNEFSEKVLGDSISDSYAFEKEAKSAKGYVKAFGEDAIKLFAGALQKENKLTWTELSDACEKKYNEKVDAIEAKFKDSDQKDKVDNLVNLWTTRYKFIVGRGALVSQQQQQQNNNNNNNNNLSQQQQQQLKSQRKYRRGNNNIGPDNDTGESENDE